MPWGLVVLVAVLVQSTLLSRVELWGVHPNLVFVLVATWALLRGRREAIGWAVGGGLLFDLFSATPFGTFTVPMLIVTFLLGYAEKLPFHLNLPLALAILFLASLLFTMLTLVLLQSLGWQVAWAIKLALMPRIAIVDLLTFALFYRPMRWLSLLAGGPKIEWT
ncbi:MAG: rod shape-determining protein MreD [Ardenticatenales bacterium]|nr:rod shape-determining protein MreD [Ardenticatenales bacterium]MCB9172003.1 rod shape-determining protein MreD [Ardenticatenales bacterium]